MNTNSFFTKTKEPYIILLERREWKAKRARILARDGHKCTKCGKKESADQYLQVHHLHYIYGQDPWEYMDSELTTLCPDCHDAIHRSTEVDVFSLVDGKLIKVELTPCFRCGGAGGFRQYKHVQGGVCFRCKGNRFEEMIEICEYYEKEHNIDLSDYSDGFRPLSSEDEKFTEVKILQSPFDSNKVYARMFTDDKRFINACLDYSVSANPGDKLDIESIWFKIIRCKNSDKDTVVLKGKVISQE